MKTWVGFLPCFTFHIIWPFLSFNLPGIVLFSSKVTCPRGFLVLKAGLERSIRSVSFQASAQNLLLLLAYKANASKSFGCLAVCLLVLNLLSVFSELY